MAMNETAEGYVLPCGRDVDTVWQRLPDVDAGRADEHDLACPYCGQARESLRALREATRELIRDDSEPSRELSGRIMSAVRAEIHRHDLLPLPTTDLGPVRISEQAIAAVLRFAADGVEGVRARRCRVTIDIDEMDIRVLDVVLDIAVGYRGFAGSALPLVRERVETAATARIGLGLRRLDLKVLDFYDV
jgi:hypothetical protein